jgi:N-methylhydantoinase A
LSCSPWKHNQQKNLILDIGGTTAKCTLRRWHTKIVTTYNIENKKRNRFSILTPVIDIVEIGNGGGSIVWIDSGGK